VSARRALRITTPRCFAWRRRFLVGADVIAWVNIDLTKNASEIGYARFLYAVTAR